MKKKMILVVASVVLNLVVLAALGRVTKVNNSYDTTTPAFVYVEHLPSNAVYSPN